MYQVKYPQPDRNGPLPGSVIPLANIRQSCMLIPKFTIEDLDKNWKQDTILDATNTYFINNLLHMYAYQTIW